MNKSKINFSKIENEIMKYRIRLREILHTSKRANELIMLWDFGMELSYAADSRIRRGMDITHEKITHRKRGG